MFGEYAPDLGLLLARHRVIELLNIVAHPIKRGQGVPPIDQRLEQQDFVTADRLKRVRMNAQLLTSPAGAMLNIYDVHL